MFGIDKQYNGHIWTKTVTTNISNILNLSFQSSSCISHLRCENPRCKYLHRAHRTYSNNDTGFKGIIKEPFFVGGPHLLDPLLFVRFARSPPSMWHCVALRSSTSMEMTQVKGLAFILVITAILFSWRL